MQRSMFLALLISLAVPGMALALESGAGTSPNILLVVADDLGSDTLTAYSTFSGVPDYVCSDGDPCNCPGGEPQCTDNSACGPFNFTCTYNYPATPTIDGLATSGILYENAWTDPTCFPTRQTLHTGMYHFRGVGSQTLAEFLPSVYDTAAFGKWNGLAQLPDQHGYDHYEVSFNAALLNYFDWEMHSSEETLPFDVTDYATTRNVDDAREWITDQATTQPWFALLAFNAGHAPYQAPPDLCHGVPCHTQDLSPLRPGDICAGAMQLPCFRAMVETMDTELGWLLASLPQTVRDATTVIFMGDDGTAAVVRTPGFPFSGNKGQSGEGGIRVPLIIDPLVGSGLAGEVEGVVNTLDLFATILEHAGTTPPTQTDSVSLVPTFTDDTIDVREHAFSCCGGTSPNDVIRNLEYKLFDGAPGKLYNLATDPYEQTNLIDSTEAVDICNREELQARLARILDENLNYTVPLPPVDFAACAANTGPTDFDGDGISDSCDNCPVVCNPDQKDLDNDSIGDGCDCDTNGIDDIDDVANGTLTDGDGNGVPDECECLNDPGGLCLCPSPVYDCGLPSCNATNCTPLEDTELNRCVVGGQWAACDPFQRIRYSECECSGGPPGCLPGANCIPTQGCGSNARILTCF